MYRVVRLFALTAVLWHLSLGCCWHHAHARELDGDEHSAHAGLCDADHHGTFHGDDSPCPHRGGSLPGRCGGERCSFVRPEAGDGLELSLQRQLLGVALHAVDAASEASLNAIDIDQPGCVDGREPLRLHLKHQVLLI